MPLTSDDMAKHFLNVPVFAGISEAALTAVESEAMGLHFSPGEIIVKEGERGGSMFIIAKGKVEVVKNLGGEDQIQLAEMSDGEFFGEMCLVEPVSRAASIRALEPTELYQLKAATLHHVFQFWPEQFSIVVLNIARDLSRRLRALDEKYAARAA